MAQPNFGKRLLTYLAVLAGFLAVALIIKYVFRYDFVISGVGAVALILALVTIDILSRRYKK